MAPSKAFSLILLGLTFCIFFQNATAQEETCRLKLTYRPALPDYYGYIDGEGNYSATFQTWYIIKPETSAINTTRTFLSISLIDTASAYCEHCTLTVFETNTFNGRSSFYDLRDPAVNQSQLVLPFSMRSYTLKCFPPTEEPEEDVDRSSEFPNIEWRQVKEDDDIIAELKENAINKAVKRMKAKEILSEGEYTITQTFLIESSANYNTLYRFTVQVSSDSGVQYKISATVLTSNLQEYEFIIYAYIENRLGEFNAHDWTEIANREELPLSEGLINLRDRAVDQAVGRMKAKDILPQGQYVITESFITEMTGEFNHPEFPLVAGYGLYRFNVQVTNESGVRFRLVVVSISGLLLSSYELIDYVYVENRLDEFEDPDWGEMNEDEDMPLPSDIIELRSRAVNQAVDRMKIKGILPEGEYAITQTFPTEYNLRINHPEFPHHDSAIHRFNVQVMNEFGVKFRIQAAAINSDNTRRYELIGYAYIENRLGEFPLLDWRRMNEDDDLPIPDDITELESKAVNQAVGRMKARGILPQGDYKITKSFITEFSSLLDHPVEFPPTEIYNLYRFNVQVMNESGVRFRLAVVTISTSFTDFNYELIDYFFIENRIDEFSNAIFRSITEEKLRTRAVFQAVDRLEAQGVIPRGQYTIVKVLETEFSAGFDHPEFSLANGDVIWRLNAEVDNGLRVFATVITNYEAPIKYELIDYGKL